MEEDDKPEDEEEVEQRRCESTPSVRGQGLQVTLAEEDDKPEVEEEIKLRRCESSPRTTIKSTRTRLDLV